MRIRQVLKIKDLETQIHDFIKMLNDKEFFPRRVVLFGSYCKGNPHAYSDIDLAVWADKFEGNRMLDKTKVIPFMTLDSSIELHPYKTGEGIEQQPFLEEILSYGIDLSEKEYLKKYLR